MQILGPGQDLAYITLFTGRLGDARAQSFKPSRSQGLALFAVTSEEGLIMKAFVQMWKTVRVHLKNSHKEPTHDGHQCEIRASVSSYVQC